jgi:hypothetical protein
MRDQSGDESVTRGSSERDYITRGRLVLVVVVVGVAALAVSGALPVQFGAPGDQQNDTPGQTESANSSSPQTAATDETGPTEQNNGTGSPGELTVASVEVAGNGTDTLAVVATVENTGTAAATDTVELEAVGLGTQTTNISVPAAGVRTATATFPDAETGTEYAVVVSSSDDVLTRTVETGSGSGAVSGSLASVALRNATTPVEAGQTVVADATVTGASGTGADWTGAVALEAPNGTVVDTATTTVGPGVTREVRLRWETGINTTVSGQLTVTAGSMSDSSSVEVTRVENETPLFDVARVRARNVTAGEPLAVNATVTNQNPDSPSAVSTATIDAGPFGSEQREVRLAGGETESISATFDTASDDGGQTVPVTVRLDNARQASVSARIAPQSLPVTVENISTTDTVAGETLDVTVTATNTGERDGTTSLTVDAGTLGSRSVSLALAAGASTTETVSFETDDTVGGLDETVTVSGPGTDRERTAQVSIPAPAPSLQITSLDVPDSVPVGGSLSASVTVRNDGPAAGTQQLTVDADDLGTETREVSLDAQETTTERFEIDAATTGTYQLTASTANDTATGTVTVDRTDAGRATFEIVNARVEPRRDVGIVEGDTFEVVLELANTGQTADTPALSWQFDGEDPRRFRGDEPLAPDSTAIVRESIEATQAGASTLTFETEGDTLTKEFRVFERAEPVLSGLDIASQGSDASILEGRDARISVEIENVGEVIGSFDVRLSLGSVDKSKTVELTPTGSQEVPFIVPADELSVQEYDVAVSSGDASVTGTLRVEEPDPAAFELTEVALSKESVDRGETVTLDATVENTGDQQGSQTVSLSPESVGDSKEVSLEADESRTVSFEVDTSGLSPGESELRVETADDSASATLTIEEPPAAARFTLSSVSVAPGQTVEQGADVNISATVSNVGGREATQRVSLTGDGFEDGTQVTLAPDATESVSFTFSTSDLSPGEYEPTLETANESVSRSLTVRVLNSVTLSLDDESVDVGGETTATVTATYSDGTQEVTQQASIESQSGVASVSGATVTGEEAGTATIEATFEGQTATASLTVVGFQSLSLSLADDSLDIGESTSATVEATYTNGTTRTVTDRATVESQSGAASVSGATVTGEEAGRATIEATFEGQTATTSLTVVGLESLSLSLAETELDIDESTSATVEATYTNGTTRTVTKQVSIRSDNSTVAVVGGATIDALAAGETVITATISEGGTLFTDTATLTVIGPTVEAISLTLADEQIEVGESTSATVEATYTNGTTVDVAQQASIESQSGVASVSGATVTGEEAGTTTIEATFEGEEATASLEVAPAPGELESLSLTLADEQIEVGESTIAAVEATYTNGTTRDVTQQATVNSGDPNIAAAGDPTIDARAPGETEITASFSQDGIIVSDTATLTVIGPTVEALSLTLADEQIKIGESTSATVEATYTNGTTVDVTQQASIANTNLKTSVDGTQITGEEAGEARIDAEFEGNIASATITVVSGVSTLEINSDKASPLSVGQESVVSVVATFENGTSIGVATNPETRFESTGPNVVTVGTGGTIPKLVAKSEGTATITATYRDVTAELLVRVSGSQTGS